MRLSAKEIAQAVKGSITAGDRDGVSKGVSIDSRKINARELFVAIKGANFDGHAFVNDVARAGAAGAVVKTGAYRFDQELPKGFFVIEVGDTIAALGGLAAHVRAAHPVPLIAITGSAGKTTTKEMIASIVGRARKVLKTEGNFNNLIGLPLTLFRFDETYEAAVVELGISTVGEMERLVDMCMPDVALITNIGRSHLMSLGSIAGVAMAKGPLFLNPPSTCVRVVNMDDEWAVRLSESALNKITFGTKEGADVRLVGSAVKKDFSGLDATYEVRGARFDVAYPYPGASNAINGAAAIAAGLSLGVSIDEIKAGLENCPQIKGRMIVVKTPSIIILDDTYNANPESMRAALATLKSAEGRRVAVLGDMLELGDEAAALHAGVGQAAAEAGVSVLFAIGQFAKDVARGAGTAGVKVFVCKDKAEAIRALPGALLRGDCVLVKASRGARLEEITEALKSVAIA